MNQGPIRNVIAIGSGPATGSGCMAALDAERRMAMQGSH